MKKIMSCVLVLALFLSLSLTGGWGVQARADTPADRAGTYELTEMVIDGEDYTEALKLSGITITLVLNADGTGLLDTEDEVLELTWDEKNITADDGIPVPYTYQDGILIMVEDETTMVFQKVDDSTPRLTARAEESIVGLWIGTLEMKDFIIEAEPDIGKFLESAPISVSMEMREDGTYTMDLDASPALPKLQAALYEYVGALCEENGITVAELEEANGQTLDELVEEAMEEMDLSEINTTIDGVYEEDMGQVVWDKGADETRGIFTGDTIIINIEGIGDAVLTRGGIVGLWIANVKLMDIMQEEDDVAQYFANVSFDMVLDLRSDNSFILSMDSSQVLPTMRVAMMGYMNVLLEENGVTAEDMEKVYGKPMDEIVEDLLAEMDFSEMEQSMTGTYTEKDGKIVLTADGSENTGSWSGSTLTMDVEEFGQMKFLHVSTEDILAKGEGAMSYAEYAAAELDTEVIIEAYVQAHQDWWDDTVTVYAQDADGGYFIYGMACSEEDAKLLEPGQKIRVTGFKSEWSGEIEITEASFEFVKGSYLFKATDVTELLDKKELIDQQNKLVAFKGMTIEAYDDTGAAFAYKDPDGKTDDLYFKASKDGKTYEFCVEFYLCGKDTEVYKTVESLQVGDLVDLEGFLYWYNGANPHITSVTVK